MTFSSDRKHGLDRIHVEDFSQLLGATRETKYNSSLEQVAQVVDRFCTFPAVEKPKLAKRLLFCFLTGNEDMHLKNFSIRHVGGVCSLTPAYDLLNTSLVLGAAKEESALPVRGKKKNMTRKLWIDYYCHERLGLSWDQINRILGDLSEGIIHFKSLIGRSFLPVCAKEAYLELLERRATILRLL